MRRLNPADIHGLAPTCYCISRGGREVSLKYNTRYDVPTPPTLLRHKSYTWREVLENFLTIISEYRCCVCRRKEIYSVRSWRIVGCTCNNKIGLAMDLGHDHCDIGGSRIVVCN